jgi:hypothetical protein
VKKSKKAASRMETWIVLRINCGVQPPECARTDVRAARGGSRVARGYFRRMRARLKHMRQKTRVLPPFDILSMGYES